MELPNGYKGLLLALMAPGLYCMLVLLGRFLKRRHGVRLRWLYHFFALGLAILVPALLLGLDWPFMVHLAAAVVILGSIVVMPLMDRYLWDLYFQRKLGVAVPKFLTQVGRLVILLVAVFLVLKIGYHYTIQGLLIAPGILAIVIGLAMQDLFGNIIAGIALQAGRPFSHGDWLFVDNRYAQVIEVNWRATRMRTTDDILIEMPNCELARQTIINLNRPQRRHAMRISVGLDYDTPPTRAKSVLLHAAASAKGVAHDPKPKVFLKNFGDSAIEYDIKFWMDDHDDYCDVADAIRTNIWYSLQRHGIKIPYPMRTVQLERPARDKQHEVQNAARIILRQQPLFKCLSDEQVDLLLPRGKVIHFGQGERLIRQGDAGDSMFILVSGQAAVEIEVQGATQHVNLLRAGDCFGEMSLLTGERRSATVTARADCEVVEIAKAVLGQTLQESPQLLERLSELLAQRQLQTEDVLAAGMQRTTAQARQSEYAAGFLDKLRAFFEL